MFCIYVFKLIQAKPTERILIQFGIEINHYENLYFIISKIKGK